MTEEEKKAIEYFKSNAEFTKELGKKWGFQEEIKNNEIILNLIQKQDTEINKLKDGLKKINEIMDEEFAVEAVMEIGVIVDELLETDIGKEG